MRDSDGGPAVSSSRSASVARDSSPPDATLAMGCRELPGFAATQAAIANGNALKALERGSVMSSGKRGALRCWVMCCLRLRLLMLWL